MWQASLQLRIVLLWSQAEGRRRRDRLLSTGKEGRGKGGHEATDEFLSQAGDVGLSVCLHTNQINKEDNVNSWRRQK